MHMICTICPPSPVFRALGGLIVMFSCLILPPQDGCLCWFDLRTKDVLLTMEATNRPISSICFKPGQYAIQIQASMYVNPWIEYLVGVQTFCTYKIIICVGNEDCVYISAGNEILSFDVRMVSSEFNCIFIVSLKLYDPTYYYVARALVSCQ